MRCGCCAAAKCGACSHQGIAPTDHLSGGNRGRWEPAFSPWPGDKLTLSFSRPTAAPGRSLTVLDAKLTLRPRERNSKALLNMTVMTSTGGVHELRIPEGVRVNELRVNGSSQPTAEQGGTLKVTLKPGRHRIDLEWHDKAPLQALYRAPQVVVGEQLANGRVTIELPRDRWFVFADGPRWGPEVQLWGYLVLLVLLALVMARLPDSPLRSWQWVVLALGLSQVRSPSW